MMEIGDRTEKNLIEHMKRKGPYKKHFYWINAREEAALRRSLAGKNIRLKSAKGVVCTPLDELNKIASVAPEVWNDTCARQGSWYRTSEKQGLYLIISSFELDEYRDQKAGVITQVDFTPPRQASMAEKEEMIKDPDFQRRLPQEWPKVEDIEKRIYLRWARRLGSEVENYDFLYRTHTANHANFIKPRFFVEEEGLLIPYSIDRSAHLCSCCVELFQILGSEYPKKYVRPCPGACIFARLTPDRYLLVEREVC